ncbi:MAG: 3-phosphoglycerate dehydrogenase [Deltaproteobacteria bacterium]|nr:3-phosphoglycerate dehydrogenase [Deltaproteobacteria bacterium]
MKVLISDSMSQVAAEVLKEAGIEVDVKTGLTPDELKSTIGDYDGLVVRSATKVTSEILGAAGKLKAIARAGTGVDNIDIRAATEKGVVVMNTPGQNSNAVAELTIGLMIALSRHIPRGTAGLKECKWEKKVLMGTEIKGKVLALIGIGNVGSIVADSAQKMGMTVIAYDPYIDKSIAEKNGIELMDDLDELWGNAHYISIHIPKTKETENLINSRSISKMRDGAYLICAARGGIVNEDDLCEALNSGKLGGAALDVFATEPPGACGLLECENFICTPHIGASTIEAQINVARAASEQVRDYLITGEARFALNRT